MFSGVVRAVTGMVPRIVQTGARQLSQQVNTPTPAQRIKRMALFLFASAGLGAGYVFWKQAPADLKDRWAAKLEPKGIDLGRPSVESKTESKEPNWAIKEIRSPKGKELQDEDFDIADRYPNCRRVDYKDCNGITASRLLFLCKCPELTDLDLSRTDMTAEGLLVLAGCLKLETVTMTLSDSLMMKDVLEFQKMCPLVKVNLSEPIST